MVVLDRILVDRNGHYVSAILAERATVNYGTEGGVVSGIPTCSDSRAIRVDSKVSRAVEYVFLHTVERSGKDNGFKSFKPLERVVADGLERIGKDKRFNTFKSVEGILTDLFQALVKGDIFKLRAVIERVITDGFNGCRNGYSFKLATATESVLAKRFYVVADGKYYAVDSAVKAGVEKYALLSNGKMVVFYGEATAKDHNWAKATKETYNTKTGDITSVKCPDCKNPVAVYKTAGVFDGKVYKQITVGVAKNYYYVAGTAANTITGTIVGVPTTPSTDKVQSAETFDAGIAMYVGMSVMAAAGSVVVLKKRED